LHSWSTALPPPASLEAVYSPNRPYILQPASASPALSTHSIPPQSSPATGEAAALSLAETAESRVAPFRASHFSLFTPNLARQIVRLPDPVESNLLSLEIATQLFDLFLQQLNQYIILLDPHLHTLDYVRRSSGALFAAMLAVSAKFHRKDLYPALLVAAQQLASRGMGGEGEQGIGLIQALLILVYWKVRWFFLFFSLLLSQLALTATLRRLLLPQGRIRHPSGTAARSAQEAKTSFTR
jgi:hypothetical protein